MNNINVGNYNGAERVFVIVNNINIYQYDFARSQFARVGVSCFNQSKKIAAHSALITDPRG